MRLAAAVTVLSLFFLAAQSATAQEAPPLSRGQKVYVPVYSHIPHGNLDSRGQPQILLLSSLLSIRNTDPGHGMVVTSARYYDTNGKVLREFVTAPITLAAMASTEFFVEHKDTTGGSGANFVVEWTAETPVNPPVIETVNAYFFGTQSVAFTSPGRTIRPNP